MRFQFTIFRLLLLTFVAAVALAVAVQLQFHWMLQAGLGGIVMLLAAWLVIRGPNLVRELREISAGRKLVKDQRRQLEAEIAANRNSIVAAHSVVGENDDSQNPS